MKSRITLCLAIALLALTQTLTQAATLQVKHSPANGQYGSIKDAITAAQNGDIIEIIDNSAPFNDTIVYQKGDANYTLTVRGKADLTPRPTIKPDASVLITSPFDPGVKSVVAVDGTITIENLIFDTNVQEANLPFDLRFCTGATVNNILLQSTKDNDIFTWLSSQNITLSNSELVTNKPVYHDRNTLNVNNTKITSSFGFWGRGGVVNFDGATVNTMSVNGGTCNFNNSTLDGGINVTGESAGGQPVVVNMNNSLLTTVGGNVLGFPARTTGDTATLNVNLTNTILTSHNPTTDNNLGVVQQGVDQVNLTVDNCDLIGNPAQGNTSSGILISNQAGASPLLVAKIVMKDTICYNLRAAGIALIGGAETDASGVTEDYNVFKAATPFFSNIKAIGAHDKVLSTELLYVDPAGGDFKIYSTSPAATLNSTGTPAYAGSQGISSVTPPTFGWPLQAIKTTTPPTIDGVINAAEWSMAVPLDLRLSTLNAKDKYFSQFTHNGSNAARVIADDADCSGLIYMTWDATNLYIAVDAKDNDLEPQPNENNDPSTNVNRGDCFQLCLDFDQIKASNVDAGTKTYIPSWSIKANSGTQTASQGNANFYQFWPLGSPNPMTGTQWNIKTGNGGYQFEAKIPWTAFTAGGDSYTKPFPPVNGQTAGMLPMLEDSDLVGGTPTTGFLYPAGAGDTTGATIGNPAAWNTVTFSTSTIQPVNAARHWEVFE